MELPAQFGKYELEKFLGGGMSQVYRARNTMIGQTVAVKILGGPASKDPNAKVRFLEEARMVASVSHDNIIRIYDFGEDAQGRPFMVMEYLQGQDLRSLIKSGQVGDLESKLDIAIQTARALEHIHSQNPPIIHRDIKPENLHINPDGKVKLMDFGIAKARDLSLTGAGLTLGTPYYMAPEQVLGRKITPLVDVYSFGIVLFELLTGIRPVGGDSIEQIFYHILRAPVNLEPLTQAGLPQPLSDLIARCIAKDPAQRPPSSTVVRQELERILIQEATTQTGLPAGPPGGFLLTRKTWLVSLGLALAAALLAFLGMYLAFRPKAAPLPPLAKKPELAAILNTPTARMVLVSAGPFLAGEDRHTETLPDFYIDQTEVTNEAYARFCREKQRPLPQGFPADRPNYPIVNITFVDAQEFAKWAGKRVPTLLEWEKAARGTDGRLFPWGNQSDPSRANVASKSGLVPVDSFQGGESLWHALNLVGNAWEFVDQPQTPSEAALKAFRKLLQPPPTATEPWYTIRGGSFRQPSLGSLMYDRAVVPARYHNDDIGFRCAKDAK